MKAAAPGGKPEIQKLEVKSFKELQQMVEQPIFAHVVMNGAVVQIPCRRVTPAESYELELVLKECLPPQKQEEGGQPYMDIDDPQYRAEKDQKRIEVRCLAAYWGCPLYRQERPNLTNRKEIVEFVQKQFSDLILRTIAGTVLEGDFEEWEERIKLF
jgi:hypothetical protein